MKITLQPHLKIRLKQRQIPQDYPEKVITKPESKYFDNLTKHLIAIRGLKYNKKLRPMAVSYDIIENEIQVITIHPISKQEITNKVQRERWAKNEED
ncbi:hypothetical protein HYS95_02175 [Candidatus Daviesbacteria bacterium]|nr:hypothetical protein [Candidatus Daviesbacteria bacterium]